MITNDAARRAMVDNQLRTFDVSDRAVLAAMDQVPRERFVPAAQAEFAYLDRNIPIAGGDDPRVMLAPMVLARMLQALQLQSGDRVLDVGGGLGYTSALLLALGCRPVLLESNADLAAQATERLGPSVTVRSGSLKDGAADDGPFDAILVNGSVAMPPETLLSQLADGGKLVCLAQEGGVGRVQLHVHGEGATGYRFLFDATAPVLAAFRPAPGFVF
jgi:protein-L-isoaspartate(D-aspartate) O-methyltransferase